MLLGWLAAKTPSVVSALVEAAALVEAVVVLGLRHPAIPLWPLAVQRGETAEVKGRNRVAQMAADQEQVTAAMGAAALAQGVTMARVLPMLVTMCPTDLVTEVMMTVARGMAAPKVTALVRVQMIVGPMQRQQLMMWMAVTVQRQLVMGGQQEELVMMMEPTH